MLLLIIGIVDAIVGLVLIKTELNPNYMWMVLTGVCCFIISTCVPISDWKEPKILAERELLPLEDGTYANIVESGGRVRYKYKLDGAKIEKNMPGENVMWYVLPHGEKPVLKEAIIRRKITLVSFPILSANFVDILPEPDIVS